MEKKMINNDFPYHMLDDIQYMEQKMEEKENDNKN